MINMRHSNYRVISFDFVKPFTLQVKFDDDTSQVIDFEPLLEGELYGPLREVSLFNQVTIDSEVHTLVWPNGADFDPATLHDWPQYAEDMKSMARRWALTKR
jgi:hypothetical protein